MGFFLIELRNLFDHINGSVDPDARETFALQFLEYAFVTALFPLDCRRIDYGLACRFQNGIHNLLGALTLNRLSAFRTVGDRGGAVENTQIIVYLGNSRHDRARIAARCSLFNRNRGA